MDLANKVGTWVFVACSVVTAACPLSADEPPGVPARWKSLGAYVIQRYERYESAEAPKERTLAGAILMPIFEKSGYLNVLKEIAESWLMLLPVEHLFQLDVLEPRSAANYIPDSIKNLEPLGNDRPSIIVFAQYSRAQLSGMPDPIPSGSVHPLLSESVEIVECRPLPVLTKTPVDVTWLHQGSTALPRTQVTVTTTCRVTNPDTGLEANLRTVEVWVLEDRAGHFILEQQSLHSTLNAISSMQDLMPRGSNSPGSH